MEHLWAKGAKVRAFDPVAMEETHRIYGDRDDLTLVNSPDEALLGASGLIIVTEWNVFRSPDFERIRSTLTRPVIFDGRNLYDPVLLKGLGIDYYGIGRGESIHRPAAP
jgi:UDPglucose 6-dehydrogenase